MANQRSLIVGFDLDTGGGTEIAQGINLRISASGGSIEAKGAQLAVSSLPVVLASDHANVPVAEAGAALTALQLIDDPVQVLGTDTYLEGTDSGMLVGVVRNDVLATLASLDNEIAPLQVDAVGALYTRIASAVALDVSAATVTVDSELPAAVALADATANPTVPGVGSFLQGFNGATWDRIRTANTGRLQVDVITGGGSDTPTNPVTQFKQVVDLANGASSDLDTTADTAAGKKLAKVSVWSSLAYEVSIHTVDNSVESTDPIAVGGGAPMSTFQYSPPHRNYHILGTTAGTDAFRVKVQNLDDSLAADVNAAIQFED